MIDVQLREFVPQLCYEMGNTTTPPPSQQHPGRSAPQENNPSSAQEASSMSHALNTPLASATWGREMLFALASTKGDLIESVTKNNMKGSKGSQRCSAKGLCIYV